MKTFAHSKFLVTSARPYFCNPELDAFYWLLKRAAWIWWELAWGGMQMYVKWPGREMKHRIVTSGDSRMKKLGNHCGNKEKSRGQHSCLSCMEIFRCNEDWFAMINPIKPNIGLWISSEPSPETLQIVKILLADCCICQWNELERQIKHKTGRQPKIWVGPWPT